MQTWVEDSNGNKCSMEYFGNNEEATRAALASLANCRNCVNCSHCSRCSYCSGCLGEQRKK